MMLIARSKSAFFLGSLLSLILCSCKAELGNSASPKEFNSPSDSPGASSAGASSAGASISVVGNTAQNHTILPAAVIVGRVKPAEVAMVEPQEETYKGLAD